MIKHYLIFDAGCRNCVRLAEIILAAGKGSLTGIDICSSQAKALLAQVYPHGWKRAPYLLRVDRTNVRSWTHVYGLVRLALLLGPRESWSVWKRTRAEGFQLLPIKKRGRKQKTPHK